MPLFLLCQVIQQPKGLIVKPTLTSAQVGLPAQKQTQPKHMVLETKTCTTGRNYAFTDFLFVFERHLLHVFDQKYSETVILCHFITI